MKRSPLHRTVRFLSRFVLYATAGVVVVILGAFLLLQTDPVRSKAKDYLESAVSKASGLRLTVDRISGDLLFSIRLEGVTLSNGKHRLIDVREISATYFTPLLLKKTLFVNEIELKKGFLNLEKGVDGKWNIPGLDAPDKPAQEDAPVDLRVFVRRAALTDIDITMVEHTAHGKITRRFTNIALVAGLSMESGAVVSADLHQIHFTLDQPQFVLRNLSGEIVYDIAGRRLQLNRMRLRSGESDLAVAGTADLKGALPVFDLTADITRLSLPEIGRLASLKAIQTGILTGRVSVNGSPDKLSHRLDLRLDRAALRTEGTVTGAAGDRPFGLDVSGDIENLNPEVLSGFGLPGQAGWVNAAFTITGTDLLNPERRGSLELEVRDSRFDRYVVGRGRLGLQVDRSRVNVTHLDLTTPMGNMAVAGEFFGFLDAQTEKTIRLQTQLSQLDVAQLSNRKDLSGKLNLTLDIDAALPGQSADLASISGKVVGNIAPSSLLDVALQKGNLDVVFDKGRLDVNRFSLDTDAGRIAVTGTAGLREQTASLAVDLNVPDLEKIGRTVARFDPTLQPLPAVSGRIDINGRFDGWWDRPNFDGTIRAQGIGFDRISVKSLTLAGQWSGPPASFQSKVQLRVNDLTRDAMRLSTLNADATLGPDTINLGLDATHPGGEKLMLRGRIDRWRDAAKQITVDSLRITADAGSGAGKFGTRLSNQGPIRISISPDSVDIRSLTMVSDEAALSLKGRLDAEKDSALALSLSRFNLDRISWLLPEADRIRGTVSADIRVSGTGKRPTLKADVRVRDGAGYGVGFSDFHVQLGYDRSKLTAAAMLNLGRDRTIELAGSADIGWTLLPFQLDLPGRGLDVSLKTKGLDLSGLPIPEIPDVAYDGSLDASIRLTGDPASPVLTGDISVTKGNVRFNGHSIPFSRLGVNLDYRKDRAGLKIGLDRSGKRLLTAAGRAGVYFSLWPFAVSPLDREMDGALDIANLDLTELSFLESAAHLDYGGRLNLSLTANGRPASPVLTAELSVLDGHFATKSGLDTMVPFSRLAAKLRYRTAKASVDITLDRDTEQLLTVNGTADVSIGLWPFRLSPGSGMEASLTSRGLRISHLPLPKIPGADIDGKIDVALHVQGQWTSPRITGDLSLAEGSASIKSPSLSYENVTAEIRLVPGKIIIDGVSAAGDTEGSLRCAGDILLSGFTPTRFNIRLTGENFFIPFHPAIRARIQPDIRLAGSMDAPELTGTVTILESRINLDRFVQKGPAEIQVKGRETDDRGRIRLADAASRGPSLLQSLSADLNVVIPRNTWLRGQGLDAEIGGTVNLKKEPQKSFILLGSLNTIRGNYGFKGKLFAFKKGTVTFLGLEEPDPNIDFTAAAKMGKVEIIIRIGGTLKDIRLSLDSNPRMEETDIVSYIMFGKPSNALNDRDSANVERAALGLTAQMAASELKSILGDDFFLDMITYESGDGENSRGSVALGKYVTPDVFVKYRQGLGGNQPSEVEASYEVNKNITIQTNVGDEKTTGVDLFWQFDF